MSSEYPLTISAPNMLEEIVLANIPPIMKCTISGELINLSDKPPTDSLLEELELLKSTCHNKKGITKALVNLMFFHECQTYQHLIEVGFMSWAMGSLLRLDTTDCLQLGLLHDVGKLCINPNLLRLKRGSSDYIPTQEERSQLHLHGEYGAMILRYLGFNDLYQHVANKHNKAYFYFIGDSIEFILVVVADWFSTIMDTNRNRMVETDQMTIDEAITKIEQAFSDSRADCPSIVKDAFFNMIRLGIYPKFNKKEPDYINMLYNIYRNEPCLPNLKFPLVVKD